MPDAGINAARRSAMSADAQAWQDIEIIEDALGSIAEWCAIVRSDIADICATGPQTARDLHWLDELASKIETAAGALCALPAEVEDVA